MTNPLLFPDIIYRLTPMYSELKKSLEIIHKLMSDIVQERKNYLATKKHATAGKMGKTFLDTLLTPTNSGKVFSFQDIRDEVNTFVLAVNETFWNTFIVELYSELIAPSSVHNASHIVYNPTDLNLIAP